MTKTILPQHGRSLLAYANARLSPEIFSHPVWIRFGQREASGSLDVIPNLMGTARNLKEQDPSATCQILLLCAVYLNWDGQPQNALRTAQQALNLARRTKLRREITWALWGMCSIAIQHGNFEQAVRFLLELQAVLSAQNEWILADYIDVLRQTFFSHGPESPVDSAVEDMLMPSLESFQQWGFTAQAEMSVQVDYARLTTPAPTSFPTQRRPGRWQSLILAIRAELRLHWIRSASPWPKRKLSFWGGLLSSLRLSTHEENMAARAPDDHREHYPHQILLPAEEISQPDAPTDKKNPISILANNDKTQHTTGKPASIPVSVHMLGAFSLTIGDLTVKLSSSRGLSIFKYLLFHHKQSTPREVLMDIFWPDADPETARNSLNVAVHGLRKALRNAVFLPVIIFEDGAYRLEENLQVWLDVEEFEQCVKAGQRLEARHQLTAAVTEYETAISLYQGDLLEQTPYEEWMVFDRERLRIAYLDTLDRLSQIYFQEERYSACRTACQLILIKDPCREDAHCLLMRCYSRQRQPHLALYQYQVCVEALLGELQVEPAPETTQLYNRIRRREQV